MLTKSVRERFQAMPEFDVVFLAKAKDKMAVEWLWEQYKGGMTSILRYVKHLTAEEQESEAFLVLEEILEYFDPDTVYTAWVQAGKDISLWKLSWLFSRRLFSRRNTLIQQSINLNKMERAYTEGYLDRPGDGRAVPTASTGLPLHIGRKYNPEELVVESFKRPLEEREAEFTARLNPYQKEILAYRRKGLTLKQIARKTEVKTGRVRYQLNRAKALAREIFEVEYA
jgi:hypothetical protein